MTEVHVYPKAKKAFAAASTALVAGGIFCAFPLLLPAAMLATAGGALAWFSETSNWLMAVAIAAIATGWIWTGVQSWRTRRRPARSTLLVLSLATMTMALAWLWPVVEALICNTA
jgi:hypothetical protein